jgi:phosphoribosylformimino-5-aminoimidazole carboxamide ribotide isomerase
LPRLVGELLVEGGSVVRRRFPPGAPGRLVAADPVAYARELAHAGITVLLLHDLDGEVANAPQALTLAARIAALSGVELWYRGGLATPGSIASAQASGASMSVLELTVLRDAAFLRYALDSYGARVAVGLDSAGSRVPSPFGEGTELSLADAAGELAFRGVGALVITDTARAGTLAGPNVTVLRQLLAAVPCRVAYGGGVASLDDLRALRDLGHATLHDVVVATALSERRLDPAEAVTVLDQGA